MYHVPFRCNVTGSTSHNAVAAGVPPVWCEGNPSACVKGAKQMLYWNQLDGNNIEVSGYDLSGGHKSPGYNAKCGFSDGKPCDETAHFIPMQVFQIADISGLCIGAQNDIFVTGSSGSGGGSPSNPSTVTPTPTPTPTPTHHTSPGGKCTKRRRSLHSRKRAAVSRHHRRHH